MELAVAVLIGIPAQVAVFALIPFTWWLHAGRPESSFPRWIGLRRGQGRPEAAVQFGLVFCGLGFFGAALLGGRPSWATPSASAAGLVVAVILTAVLQAALSEELFFRGFLLRWLKHRMQRSATDAAPSRMRRALQRPGRRAVAANAVQAALCGLLRMAVQWLFLGGGLQACLAALALGSGAAFLAGWVTQRTKSLLLPWAAHGVGNVAGTLIVTLR